jgi:hypothetical protein
MLTSFLFIALAWSQCIITNSEYKICPYNVPNMHANLVAEMRRFPAEYSSQGQKGQWCAVTTGTVGIEGCLGMVSFETKGDLSRNRLTQQTINSVVNDIRKMPPHVCPTDYTVTCVQNLASTRFIFVENRTGTECAVSSIEHRNVMNNPQLMRDTIENAISNASNEGNSHQVRAANSAFTYIASYGSLKNGFFDRNRLIRTLMMHVSEDTRLNHLNTISVANVKCLNGAQLNVRLSIGDA